MDMAAPPLIRGSGAKKKCKREMSKRYRFNAYSGGYEEYQNGSSADSRERIMFFANENQVDCGNKIEVSC